MTQIEHSTIEVDGVALALVIERKAVKNVNARLRGDTLFVSAPRHLSRGSLQQVLPDLARRLVRRVRARQINRDDEALLLAQRVAARFPHPVHVNNVMFVTNQTARWGSYSTATGSIRLNAALRYMPAWVLEAVMAHELAHVPHPHHGPEFWELLHQVCPQTERADAFLAGVSWLGHSWDDLPPVEQSLLRGNAANSTELP